MNRRFQGKLKVTQSDIINILGDLNAVTYEGVIDCSSNPNYPAADAGDIYIVSVAGKIGGASGIVVVAGDIIICKTDSTATGDQATVGTSWNVIEKNIDLTNVVISGGTISGTNITVGSGKTLDVSAGTMTFAARQVSGASVVAATEIAEGVQENSTDVEAVAKSANNKSLVPSNIPSIMASPGAIGETLPNTVRGYYKRISKSASGYLTKEECAGTVIDNYGQTASMTLTLPSGESGIGFLMEVTVGGNPVYLKSPPSDKFFHDGIYTDDGDKIGIAAPAHGDTVWIESMRSGESEYNYRSTSGIGAWADSGA